MRITYNLYYIAEIFADTNGRSSIAATLPLLIFVFLSPRSFLIEPFGVIFGETYAVSFFINEA